MILAFGIQHVYADDSVLSFESVVLNPDGSTTWTYSIVSGNPELSHWILAVGDCARIYIDWGSTDGFEETTDPHFELTGIKWETNDPGQGATVFFSFTIGAEYNARLGEVEYGMKSGGNKVTGLIPGPVCEGGTLVVPENPFGTLGSIGVMIAALFVFTNYRKNLFTKI
jgi:hypothetical protein